MQRFKQLIKHSLTPSWLTRRIFDDVAMKKIEQAIAIAEQGHSGEICFAIESGLSTKAIWYGQTPRGRALELFSVLNIWDTENNNGVLLYLEMADKKVEIIADRGAASFISNDQWQKVCTELELSAQRNQPIDGVINAIEQIGNLLREYFALSVDNNQQEVLDNINELSNKPRFI